VLVWHLYIIILVADFAAAHGCFITLGNTSAENKGLKCIIAYNNIQSMFPNHVLYQLRVDLEVHKQLRRKTKTVYLLRKTKHKVIFALLHRHTTYLKFACEIDNENQTLSALSTTLNFLKVLLNQCFKNLDSSTRKVSIATTVAI